jgi:hypothetical protein
MTGEQCGIVIRAASGAAKPVELPNRQLGPHGRRDCEAPMPDANTSSPGPSGSTVDSQQLGPPSTNPSVLTALRIVGFAGTSAVVVWHAASLGHIKPRQESGFVVLAVAGLAIGLTFRVLLSAAAQKLLRHKDVLIPLGLYRRSRLWPQCSPLLGQ